MMILIQVCIFFYCVVFITSSIKTLIRLDYIENSSETNIFDDAFTADEGSSLSSELYNAMNATNLSSDHEGNRRSSSYDNFGEGPSFSRFMSPPPFAGAPQLNLNDRNPAFVPPPLSSVSSQTNLNEHISNMRQNIKISSYFTKIDRPTGASPSSSQNSSSSGICYN